MTISQQERRIAEAWEECCTQNKSTSDVLKRFKQTNKFLREHLKQKPQTSCSVSSLSDSKVHINSGLRRSENELSLKGLQERQLKSRKLSSKEFVAQQLKCLSEIEVKAMEVLCTCAPEKRTHFERKKIPRMQVVTDSAEEIDVPNSCQQIACTNEQRENIHLNCAQTCHIDAQEAKLYYRDTVKPGSKNEVQLDSQVNNYYDNQTTQFTPNHQPFTHDKQTDNTTDNLQIRDVNLHTEYYNSEHFIKDFELTIDDIPNMGSPISPSSVHPDELNYLQDQAENTSCMQTTTELSLKDQFTSTEDFLNEQTQKDNKLETKVEQECNNQNHSCTDANQIIQKAQKPISNKLRIRSQSDTRLATPVADIKKLTQKLSIQTQHRAGQLQGKEQVQKLEMTDRTRYSIEKLHLSFDYSTSSWKSIFTRNWKKTKQLAHP